MITIGSSLKCINDLGERDWFVNRRGQWGYWSWGPVECFRWPGYMRSYWVYGIGLTALRRRVAIVVRTGKEA